MVCIDARNYGQTALNQNIQRHGGDLRLEHCLGQRFIAAGRGEGHLEIYGVPGNALGAYLNGADVEVMGNAQDAVVDSMNAGRIVVHSCIGDTVGYAMRGGELYVEGSAGYRAGIHSNYPCTGMHGGKLFLRSDCRNIVFPKQVSVHSAAAKDMEEVIPCLRQYARLFQCDYDVILDSAFTVVVPDSQNPYQQMYVAISGRNVIP